jgi:hypothetical protein
LAGADTGVLELPYQATTAITKLRFVKLSGDQTVAAVAAVTDQAIGVAKVDISAAEFAAGKGTAVQVLGVAWVEAAAAITRGNFVAPSANGRAQTAVSTQFGMGIALKAAANAGDWIPVLLLPYLRTTAMGTA